jgi:drug/metabolite transporter (DMT)-like permease
MASPAPSTSPDRVTLLAFAGVVLFGGLNTIAVRQTVLELAPFWGAALRFLAAGLIFAVLTIGRGRSFPSGRSLGGAMLYGTVGFAGAFGLIYPALRTVHAGTAAVVIALSPLATYGLAVLQRQERIRAQGLVGAVVALLGIGIIFIDQLGSAVSLGALVMVALGMVCLSESGIIVKWIPRSDPFATNAVAMLTAGGILLAASYLAGEAHSLPLRSGTWLALGYITLFGSVAMFGLYLFGLRRWTASSMSYSTLMLPFVSVTAATLLTGEAFSLGFVLGGLVMLVGVYIGAFGHARPHRSTATSLPECLPIADCLDDVRPAPAAVPGSAG